MSKSLNQTVKYWKDLECKLRGIPSSSALNADDRNSLVRALILNSSLVEDALLLVGITSRDSLTRWMHDLIRLWDVRDVASCFKASFSFLANLSIDSIGRDGIEGYSNFKHSIKQDYPLAGAYLAPIKGCYQLYITTGNGIAFRAMSQFLQGWTRIRLSCFDYSDDCIQNYIENERRLRNLNTWKPLTSLLAEIWREWSCDLNIAPDDVVCNHGPGAVALRGRISLYEKYLSLSNDALTRYCLKDEFPFSNGDELHRQCEVVFVPKSILTWRTISMEPPALQFLQQGIWHVLDKWMMTHPVLRRHVHLHDQTFNRERARVASVYPCSFATIDLSDASDSVSWELVKDVFSHTPIYRWLVASRSREAILPGSTEGIKLSKFAPMGSALCFPIECIIFSLICEAASRCCHTPSNYLVYGDDIIVEDALSSTVCEFLEILGFKVNQHKSFTNPEVPFRESCGGEFLGGVDVTPLRLPRNFEYKTGKRLMSSPGCYTAYVSLCNEMFDRQHRAARSIVLSDLLALPPKYRPLFDDGSKGIRTQTPSNFHLQYRPNYNLHGIDFVHGGVQSEDNTKDAEFKRYGIYDKIRFYEWTRTVRNRDLVIEPVPICILRRRPVLRAVTTTIT